MAALDYSTFHVWVSTYLKLNDLLFSTCSGMICSKTFYLYLFAHRSVFEVSNILRGPTEMLRPWLYPSLIVALRYVEIRKRRLLPSTDICSYRYIYRKSEHPQCRIPKRPSYIHVATNINSYLWHSCGFVFYCSRYSSLFCSTRMTTFRMNTEGICLICIINLTYAPCIILQCMYK
jgi:hypothetical protein